MKQRITKFVNKHPDKILHLIVGYLIAQMLFYIPYLNFVAILPVVFLISFSNELIDSIKEEFSWKDIQYTIIGAFISCIVMLIYNYINNIPIYF